MGRYVLALLAAAAFATLGCDAASGAADAGPTGCPPPAPWGYEVGDRLTNLDFADCDGQSVDLHSLCGRVGVVVAFYGWCASCPHYAELADSLMQEYGSRGLTALVVVVEDGLREPASAACCAEVRDYLGLTVATVIDPAHTLEAYGDTDLVVISDRGGHIVFKRQGPDDHAVRTAVEAALEP
ncbi:MAG: redoxin family protein [Deltaproteobacteria bacterium]|nr:redoxin family protein [Deltaproteobacteria bacterium]